MLSDTLSYLSTIPRIWSENFNAAKIGRYFLGDGEGASRSSASMT